LRFNGLRDRQGVGAGQQKEPQTARLLAIPDRGIPVALASKGNAGDIAQANRSAVAVGQKDDVVELLRRVSPDTVAVKV